MSADVNEEAINEMHGNSRRINQGLTQYDPDFGDRLVAFRDPQVPIGIDYQPALSERERQYLLADLRREALRESTKSEDRDSSPAKTAQRARQYYAFLAEGV